MLLQYNLRFDVNCITISGNLEILGFDSRLSSHKMESRNCPSQKSRRSHWETGQVCTVRKKRLVLSLMSNRTSKSQSFDSVFIKVKTASF